MIQHVRTGLLMIHAADELTRAALCGAPIDLTEDKVSARVPVTCRACRAELATVRYAFCESVGASGSSSIHIRILSAQGRFVGGGADTPALCGRVMAWDLEGPVSEDVVAHRSTCPSCRLIWRDSTGMQARLAERSHRIPA